MKIGPSSRSPIADRQVNGTANPWCQRQGGDLAALAHHGEGAVATLQTERFDVGADRLGDPQPVQRQQRHQGVITG
jgi:hypothetical protein